MLNPFSDVLCTNCMLIVDAISGSHIVLQVLAASVRYMKQLIVLLCNVNLIKLNYVEACHINNVCGIAN